LALTESFWPRFNSLFNLDLNKLKGSFEREKIPNTDAPRYKKKLLLLILVELLPLVKFIIYKSLQNLLK